MAEEIKPVYCLAVAYEDGSVFIDSTVRSEVELTGMAKPGGNARIIRVKVAEHRKRSLPASSLIHVWIKALSGFTGEDIKAQKQILKIKFGYSILLAEGDDISVKLEWMFKRFKWEALTWPQKIELAEMIPCTSIMTTKQLKEMMENIKGWAMNTYNVSLDNGKR